MEERTHHCLILEEGNFPEVGSLSFRLKSEDELAKASSYFGNLNFKCDWVERPFRVKLYVRSIPMACL